MLFPKVESNHHLAFRKRLFYPLNYSGICSPEPVWGAEKITYISI